MQSAFAAALLALLALVAPVLAPSASVASAQSEAVRTTTDVFPGQWTIERGAERWLCYRIVDDTSGRSIADAELFLVAEHDTPLAGTFWSTRSAVSDADGFVRLRVDDIEGEWDIQVLSAEGHAVSSRGQPGEPIWRIAAAQDVPVLVRDWRGMPVAGALIGFCGSCGHGPDLANATSDANGIAILRGIDPHNSIADLYCQARGLELGYQSVEWRPGDAPFDFTCEYSTPLTGKLVDHSGAPIAGAFVGQPDVHRGPWTMTRADGTFEVLGASSDSWLRARFDGREVHFPEFASIPTVLRAPLSRDENEGTVDAPAPEIQPGIALVNVAVRVQDESVVYASAPGFPTQKSKDGRIDVPPSGPFALHVGERILSYSGVDELRDRPELPGDFAPTLVRGTAVDPAGRAVAVRASLRAMREESGSSQDSPDGGFQLASRATGKALLELVPERTDLRPRRLYVTLPPRGDEARVDVGRVTLVGEPALRVLDASGAPRTDVDVSFGRDGYFEVGAGPQYELDADGGWTGPDLRAGDALVVAARVTESDAETGRIAVPFRSVLSGEGPWTITPPMGVLDLEVRGLDGKAHVLIADRVFDVGASSTWTGLTPGPVTLWITAAGRRTSIVTTKIAATGTNAVTVELAPL